MPLTATALPAPAPIGQRFYTVGRIPALGLPLVFTLGLSAICLLPSVRAQHQLPASILGACGVLVLWSAVLAVRSRGRVFRIDIQLRAQHYLQACAQGTVLLYWGYYWRPVYDAAPLLVAQLAFAYAFDMLLAWSRRDDYTLGFAPFPVVFSTNLFLWFKADWFYLQFLLIGLGFAAKDMIRWNKNGRRTHIFNPSSFPLAVFSLVLIATGTTSMTWGPEIARTQFNPPHIYLLLFLVGLPGQILFGVTSMTMSAVVTTYVFGLAYFWLTGTYFFVDSFIPVAVFLGMHLLFTDPSTAPRTESGRFLFGAMYGLANIALYTILGRLDIPRFYDKLLPVPLLNLSIQLLDRAAPHLFGRLDPARIATSFVGRRRNVLYVSVWSVIFATMYAVGGVGDNHPGHRVPFWQEACQQNRPGACQTLADIAGTYCHGGSGWACNERGVLRSQGKAHLEKGSAVDDFNRACSLRFAQGCSNAALAGSPGTVPVSAPPTMLDYPIIVQTGKAQPRAATPAENLAAACEQGFLTGCEDLGEAYLGGAYGMTRDPQRAEAALARACTGGRPRACSNLGYMYYTGDGVALDKERGLGSLKRACDLGMTQACQWLSEAK
jgi:hypothetical protein